MPLPALPSSKTRSRLPETPNSSLGRRESSGSGIPTPTSSIPTPTSPTRKTTPVGLARLRVPAVQSTTSLASPTKDSPSSPISPVSSSRRRSFRKTVSIGSFPQPPRGGFGALGSISSSPESTPSLPSSTKANTPLAFSSRATSPATLADAPKPQEDEDLFPPRSSSLAVTSNEQKKLSLIEERRASEVAEAQDNYDPPRSNSLAVTSNEHKKLSQIEEKRTSQHHAKLSIFPAPEPSSRRASKAESLPLPKLIASPALRQEDSGIRAPVLRRKSSSPLLRQGPFLTDPMSTGMPIPKRKASSPLLQQIELPEDLPPPPPPPTRTISPTKSASTNSTLVKEQDVSAELPSVAEAKESTPSPKSATNRVSGLPTIKGKRTASVASSTRRSDRHLNIPSDLDSRPSSAHGSAITDGTHFEDIDPLTAASTSTPTSIPSGWSRPSDAGSIRSLRSTKSESNLKFGKEYSKEGKDMKGNVVVSVRVRPNGSDTTANPDWVVDNKGALISYKGGEGGDFRYDNVFSNGDDNGRVYDSAAKRLVRRVMEGYHGTVFAYGCTSTGKTFSMQGTAASPGIIPLAITDIFSYIREQPHREFLLRVAYLEIYNEKIYDLLSPNAGAGMQEDIKLREDSKRGVYATPLKEEIVQSPTQLLRVIARGDLCRRTGSTQFNARSSRSHAVVQIVVESRARVDPASSGLPSGVLVSTLSLIDLAGSERAAEDKDRRKEGSHINKSLLTLGTVISRLSEQKPDATALPSKSHLPYRDSKLTRLLSSALSGNSLISILCTIQLSPMGAFGPLNAMAAPSETLNTLTFASRAKNNIVSHAKRNESIPGLGGEARALLDRYKAEIEDLRKQLDSQTRNSAAPETPLSITAESKEARPERTEEEERKWLERERESAERHEAQMLEMQLARTALKERIGHLNRLILSSKSVGVNAGVKVRDRRAPAPDEVGVALGSPEVSRQGSLVEGFETSRPGYQRAFSLGSAGLRVPGFVAGEALAEESEDDLSAESGEASPASRITALQADVRDKNRYIATLERRLLEARRTSGGKRRKSSGVGTGGWEEVVAEKDREIEELKKRLDDAARMGNALRSAARRRDMVDIRSGTDGLGLGGGLSIDVPKSRKISTITSPTGQGHAHTMSMSSNGSRSINFSRLTPVGILSPSKAGFGEDPVEVERPMDSGKSLRSQKSLEEMTRMLDGMIAQKVEEGVPGLFGVKTVMQVAVGDAR
ncbi:hypothetical protein KVT40_008729 [Elsinoe batatas]|uniref:Kinesin-like protein KIP2 n=1 Tax=Elsinoe batatas TaxID=2601811 RepID=A0A8K0L0V8_9PEZI|nr:hypothetical protein KVT40_008729 [Elsinoe batatas]